MARTPNTTTPAATPAVELRPDAVEAANVLAAVTAEYGEERDLANQLLGQIQMANAFGKWTTVVYLSKLEQVRQSKLYRALPAKNVLDANGNEIADCRLNTWDGYCRALGLSANKVEEDLLNLRTFGQDALENMGRLGIGYREMRQFRKLPEDQKLALIEVAKAGDKESFVELAEEIIARHAKEKEILIKQVKEIAADKEATERVAQLKQDTINQLQHDVVKLSNPLNVLPWDTRVAPFQNEITERQSLIDAAIGQHEMAIKALDAWLTQEATSQPDYDPEAAMIMPEPVRAVLLALNDAVTRTASLAAGLQHALQMRFGGDIAEARMHVLNDEV